LNNQPGQNLLHLNLAFFPSGKFNLASLICQTEAEHKLVMPKARAKHELFFNIPASLKQLNKVSLDSIANGFKLSYDKSVAKLELSFIRLAPEHLDLT
jgi:hypothetical protein